MTSALLSLGSNLGDRLRHLRGAVLAFGEAVVLTSPVYETPPWGDPDQPHYLNAVLLVTDPTASARDWLERAQAAEREAGRVRDPERRFGPRTLDVDVISVWDEDDQPVISEDPELTLPHPRAHLRAFVLRPWADVQPYGRLAGHGWLTDLLDDPALEDDLTALIERHDRIEPN